MAFLIFNRPLLPNPDYLPKISPVSSLIDKFIGEAKKHFKFCEIHLNYDNRPAGCILRANFILDLNNSYPEIRKGYKKNYGDLGGSGPPRCRLCSFG